MNKAVFLDRDGVLNNAIIKSGKPYPPAQLSELAIAEDVLPALNHFKKLGYLLIGATNQPDVARGTTLQATVEAINTALMQKLPIDSIFVCYHDDQDDCQCRKPRPGMLLSAAQQYNIDLAKSYMIGDRSKDIAAGQAAGCTTLFLDYGYQETTLNVTADHIITSLKEAINFIIG